MLKFFVHFLVSMAVSGLLVLLSWLTHSQTIASICLTVIFFVYTLYIIGSIISTTPRGYYKTNRIITTQYILRTPDSKSTSFADVTKGSFKWAYIVNLAPIVVSFWLLPKVI